jgi:hypothetical protein
MLIRSNNIAATARPITFNGETNERGERKEVAGACFDSRLPRFRAD